ncbi:MAG: ABC transporter ATP-binding protein [Chloroflexi bacterium AL-W]|nr:ABC transporter ATP-binding protein [Chloroflexi bacterium AL-N1]NOK70809.1 ABC transporter ATP-binding protein [Chloroflexi bacterium AL-N10]NOK78369.1 ABC transporter ATP-binding protein [Chloroflexi bacterium AL-N5]NOK85350.1 ABC transporter ATP-binding protein [Chloroflexi bacterium AL-W]NOK92626.1 ABC transporter ATP-binding protein [Chloroflexi bacterium AL-N15]
MIEASHLQKIFGSFQAVQDISLNIDDGEVVALLGPNGAGKTTTVRMLAAILKPTHGYARIAGLDVVENAREVRKVVGLLTEFPGLYHRMRPVEYLRFFGSLQGLDDATCLQRSEQLLKRFDLWHARGKRIDSFSKGMKQKVALIRALIHDPPVLYLDEPTTAMDPHSARTVRDAIAELRKAHRTILLTTHNLIEAETLADRIVIVRGGRIIAQGTIDQLTRQLLGDPIWELRFATDIGKIAPLFEDLVQIEATGADWVQYRCTEPQHINPQLMARLTSKHLPVVSMTQMSRSLEEIYLRTIVENEAERGVWDDQIHSPSHTDMMIPNTSSTTSLATITPEE